MSVKPVYRRVLGEACLQASREADQVGANTETGTRAGRRADRRGVDVENGEHGQRRQGNRADLVDAELLAWEQVAGDGDGEALEGILHEALDEVGDINANRRGGGSLGRGIGHLFILVEGDFFSLVISICEQRE